MPRFLDRPFGDNLFINPLYELDEKLGNLEFTQTLQEQQLAVYRLQFHTLLESTKQSFPEAAAAEQRQACQFAFEYWMESLRQNIPLHPDEIQRQAYRTEFDNLLKALNQPAQIVVAGGFNAGKSSFINALLGGQEVMPVLAVRCTASVNCLIKGEKRQLIVQRPNGQADRFDYADDADLVAQVRTLMKQERKRIERIDIARPDLHFLDKFTLVDTPGLDFNQQDTAASIACIRRADAMIWVLHPEGLRKDDLQRIREFHDTNPKSPLIVIINRIDKLDAEEISTVVEDVKTGLQGITDRVFPLSAYLACQGLQEQDLLKLKESRFRELEHYLHNHLFTAYRDLQNQRLGQKWSGQAQALAGEMRNFLKQHTTGTPGNWIADRYEKTADGTEVIDHQTGLIWRREIERRKVGFIVTTESDRFTYEEALAHADKVARQTGLPWRVPTVDELKTLIDDTRLNPASRFPDMPSIWFWSSSPYVGNANFAWFVVFDYGLVSSGINRSNSGAVRLVRGG